MSVFNMMLGGGGAGESEFKIATPAIMSASSLAFALGYEPKEYILMLTPSGYFNGMSNTKIIALIAKVSGHENLGTYMTDTSSVSHFYNEGLEGNVSATYDGGYFYLDRLKSQYQFLTTSGMTAYELFYKED